MSKHVKALLGIAADLALAGLAVGLSVWLLLGGAPRPVQPRSFAATSRAAAVGAAVTVHLGADNRPRVGDVVLDEAALLARLQPGGQPASSVALQVSAEALFANVASALALAGRAGVGEVQISVVP